MWIWIEATSCWVLNLDGSDARCGLTVPRLEVHKLSSRAWVRSCVLGDGRVELTADGCRDGEDGKLRALKSFQCSPDLARAHRELIDRLLRFSAGDLESVPRSARPSGRD